MKRSIDFSNLHKRVTILDEPVWVCVSAKSAGAIPIGQFSRMCEHGLIATTTDEEQEAHKTYTDEQEEPK